MDSSEYSVSAVRTTSYVPLGSVDRCCSRAAHDPAKNRGGARDADRDGVTLCPTPSASAAVVCGVAAAAAAVAVAAVSDADAAVAANAAALLLGSSAVAAAAADADDDTAADPRSADSEVSVEGRTLRR
jgi:hypothetical protein